MTSHARSLRSIGALCLALALYAAVPHFHAEFAQAPAHARLAPDDAHESHSPAAVAEAAPCTLCRATHARSAAPPPPALVHAAPIASPRRIEPPHRIARPELLLAGRHPTRAPPLA
jgi:hypothetical protein